MPNAATLTRQELERLGYDVSASLSVGAAVRTQPAPSAKCWKYAGPQQRRASGLLEAQEQDRIVKMFLLAGAKVKRLSQARATKQSPGLGDLFVLFTDYPRLGAWWETKIEGGEISDAQEEFAIDCSCAMMRYQIGDTRAAADWLVTLGRAVYDEKESIGIRFERSHF